MISDMCQFGFPFRRACQLVSPLYVVLVVVIIIVAVALVVVVAADVAIEVALCCMRPMVDVCRAYRNADEAVAVRSITRYITHRYLLRQTRHPQC